MSRNKEKKEDPAESFFSVHMTPLNTGDPKVDRMLAMHGHGFWVHFPNGYGVSVQFSAYNYCEHEGDFMKNESERYVGEGRPPDAMRWRSHDAECAVLTPHGLMNDPFGWGDQVKGHMNVLEVLDLMNKVAALPPAKNKKGTTP